MVSLCSVMLSRDDARTSSPGRSQFVRRGFVRRERRLPLTWRMTSEWQFRQWFFIAVMILKAMSATSASRL